MRAISRVQWAAAVAAALVLADASVVVLALPPILIDLHASVAGVAAVIGAYTLALGLLLPLFARLRTDRRLPAAGMLCFAAASAGCGAVSSLPALVALRAVQGAAGAAVLVAAFTVLRAGADGEPGRRLWRAAAVLGSAAGPALGGALTQLLDWRAIFFVQAPLVAIAGLICLASPGPQRSEGDDEPPPPPWYSPRAVCLALLSAALTGVLFLLVLLLISGWALSPLTAAGTVTVLPAAALIGTLVPGPAQQRAAAGCLLVGGGVLSLAFIRLDSIGLTIAPQAVAGIGMGMALPALAGDLLEERTGRQAARLLAIRHLGVTLALALLAPIASAQLHAAVDDVRLKGVALFLDAKLPPLDKLDLAQVATSGLKSVAPRSELDSALSRSRAQVGTDDRPEFDSVRSTADRTLVAGVNSAFRPAFVVCAAMAFLAALVLFGTGRFRIRPVLGVCVVAVAALLAGQIAVASSTRVPHITIADPCQKRALPHTGGIGGFLQERVLQYLDQKACDYGSSREALALAIASPSASKQYAHKYGVDPRQKLAPLIKLLNVFGN